MDGEGGSEPISLGRKLTPRGLPSGLTGSLGGIL